MPSCYFFPRLECFTPDSLMEIRCDKVFQNPYLKLYLDHMPIWPLKKLAWDCHRSKLPKMISRASLSVAYGESLSNMLQPFYLLIVMPIMATGVRLQARDIMGYLVIPFLVFFIMQSIFVLWIPI